MTTRMLIDARHAEETRVAVLEGKRIEEFDFESAEHKQIKGNIYLAKVTRVEPSLQAAFVEFGGNRHGFLAFGEIHPDYYQIPAADRQALLEEEAAAAEEEARLRAEDDELHGVDGDADRDDLAADELDGDGVEEIDTAEKAQVSTIEEGVIAEAGSRPSDDDEDYPEDAEDDAEPANGSDDGEERGERGGRGRGRNRRQGRSQAKAVDEARERRLALRRRYKIQDVIQRRQVLLVQVVKEERGNKGAALTTYLSLAGRYTVLMPNSAHGGGISRKIASTGDRKRLKQIVSDLELPRSMGLIVRTAGLQRSKPEIKRDFDYLARLWDEIREKTLRSTAPTLIHSDSDLIKRAIRDLYNRDIEEVVVEGEDGFRSAREFMKLLMPSHVRRVKPYSDPVPLFQRYGAEDQLRAMYDPVVQLKSGGYLVINPTEALVSIDINSGRSTREMGIEQTAVATNLEAAEEIARQLRLRDMAGLVVIDFIDMERSGNIRKVERCLKEALKNDRARIQIGRISGFGLLEMSRQRLRTGVLEATTRECPHCDGTGLVRTASSAGLSALRLIEEEAARGKGSQIVLSASTEAAIYLLNAKRADLQEIEDRYGVTVEVRPEGEEEGAKMSVSSLGPRPRQVPRFEPIAVPDEPIDDMDDLTDDEPEDQEQGEDEADGRTGGDDSGKRKRRRRRGGRNRNRLDDRAAGDDEDEDDAATGNPDAAPSPAADTSDDSESEPDDAAEARDTGLAERRPRRRRGGRGRRQRGEQELDAGDEAASFPAEDQGDGMSEAAPLTPAVEEQLLESIAVVAGPDDAPETAEAMAQQPAAEAEIETAVEAPAKPKRRAPRKRKAAEGEVAPPEAEPSAEAASPVQPLGKPVQAAPSDTVEEAAEERPATEAANDADNGAEPQAARRGWWQRTFGD